MSDIVYRIKDKIHRLTHAESGRIWILHRVEAGEDGSFFRENRDLSISVAELERQVLKTREAGYEFVSMDEACRRQESGAGRKYAAVTFDDGYLDNLTVAYPVLKRLGVPFTIFVVTDFLNHKANLWWYWIEKLHEKDPDNDFKKLHDLFLGMTPDEQTRYLTETYPGYAEWNAAELDRLALTSEQVAQLSQDSLCTIGIHTVSHCKLELLDREGQFAQIAGAKDILEHITGCPVLHLSYPYGSFNSVTEEVCRNLGLRSALNSWGGPMRRSDSLISGKRTKILTDD